MRTLDEIAAWSTLSEGAKRSVWKLLGPRRRLVAAGASEAAAQPAPPVP
jgi:predicted Fe-S protein YdhL (DUF1289 family)